MAEVGVVRQGAVECADGVAVCGEGVAGDDPSVAMTGRAVGGKSRRMEKEGGIAQMEVADEGHASGKKGLADEMNGNTVIAGDGKSSFW